MLQGYYSIIFIDLFYFIFYIFANFLENGVCIYMEKNWCIHKNTI